MRRDDPALCPCGRRYSRNDRILERPRKLFLSSAAAVSCSSANLPAIDSAIAVAAEREPMTLPAVELGQLLRPASGLRPTNMKGVPDLEKPLHPLLHDRRMSRCVRRSLDPGWEKAAEFA